MMPPLHLFQSAASAADPLFTQEHGLVAAVTLAIGQAITLANNHFRRKKRNGSLAHEVQAEVTRILNQRAAQDTYSEVTAKRDLDDLTRSVARLESGQIDLAGQLGDVKTQVGDMREGIIRLVASMAPDKVKELFLGRPR